MRKTYAELGKIYAQLNDAQLNDAGQNSKKADTSLAGIPYMRSVKDKVRVVNKGSALNPGRLDGPSHLFFPPTHRLTCSSGAAQQTIAFLRVIAAALLAFAVGTVTALVEFGLIFSVSRSCSPSTHGRRHRNAIQPSHPEPPSLNSRRPSQKPPNAAYVKVKARTVSRLATRLEETKREYKEEHAPVHADEVARIKEEYRWRPQKRCQEANDIFNSVRAALELKRELDQYKFRYEEARWAQQHALNKWSSSAGRCQELRDQLAKRMTAARDRALSK
ncbi:hypothetical protein HRG_011372 [Hirsutella rhossiliensis]|uniref:Uncharacterized protein n=1 Tax=Hirsutella rhossiliensis TaxID=111463 RepID=A0A9P8SDQ6_9HYPO|nr:uncharacterized protein HRG_11372 [Hirsutella rhossiliensis]KAH0957590.1 hypothetical protein HRG_11372 [Hirsutella rhossiliensis]